MFCNGFLGGGAQETRSFSDIWRVREDDVESPAGAVAAQVCPDDRDAVLEPVEADVAAGEGGQAGLDLQGGQAGELPAAEEKGDDPAPGAELEDILPRLRPDEIGQERGVEGEPVAVLPLTDDDPASKESAGRLAVAGTDGSPDII